MKLLKHKLERRGDQIKLEGVWRDQMRRPASVTVKVENFTGEAMSLPDVIMEGDVREVDGVLSGLAEIAWQRGWRPVGLLNKIALILDKHEIEEPKE